MGIKVWRLEEIPEDAERVPAGYVCLAEPILQLGSAPQAQWRATLGPARRVCHVTLRG